MSPCAEDGFIPSGFKTTTFKRVNKQQQSNTQQDEDSIILQIKEQVFDKPGQFFSVNADKPERCQIYERSRTHYEPVTRSHLRRLVLQVMETDYRQKYSNKVATEVIDSIITEVELPDEEWSERVNPDGWLNCSNGILKVEPGAEPQLFPHGDPEVARLIFLSEPMVRFDPLADTTAARQLLFGCLEGESLQLYKRLIGSTLNYRSITSKHARIPMIVSADTSGMNGKSVNDECVAIIHGMGAVAHVGLETFKDRVNEDSDKNGMWQLINKRYNCPTESLCNFNLSDNKLIKQTTSGEDITTRPLYRGQFTFRPRCGMHFSLNRMPLINTSKESATSRIRVIQWPHTFKMQPDPDKPHEKQANPKFDPKNKDKTFLYEELLPGYLLLMLEGYAEAYANGFPEAESLALINEMQTETDHVSRFLADMGLERSEATGHSISLKDLYALYEYWIYADDEGESLFRSFEVDGQCSPVRYNPLIKSKDVGFQDLKVFPRQLAKHLQAHHQIRSPRLNPAQAEELGVKRCETVRVGLIDKDDPTSLLIEACGRQQVGKFLLGYIPEPKPMADWETEAIRSNAYSGLKIL